MATGERFALCGFRPAAIRGCSRASSPRGACHARAGVAGAPARRRCDPRGVHLAHLARHRRRCARGRGEHGGGGCGRLRHRARPRRPLPRRSRHRDQPPAERCRAVGGVKDQLPPFSPTLSLPAVVLGTPRFLQAPLPPPPVVLGHAFTAGIASLPLLHCHCHRVIAAAAMHVKAHSSPRATV